MTMVVMMILIGLKYTAMNAGQIIDKSEITLEQNMYKITCPI